eukprot:TRINITY_DN11226_c0_g1_i2.p1 TRINITY_DN11226_c0_g1~~TRINITY_DN11226_c0_g1_i2.p1  ORF type:complete len:974 (+),score=220.25 TRINITY_DN11226_c0_g1_i2:57-2978(+)
MAAVYKLLPLSRSSATNLRQLSTSARNCNAKAYDHTLLLPKTAFPMRANASVREPKIQAALGPELYQQLRSHRKATSQHEEFIVHDGPPFANGDIHIGHVLNKVLKDIIVRSRFLDNRCVSFIPGWDCHGLPIEAKAVSAVYSTRNATDAHVTQVRTQAAEFATDAIRRQKADFQRLGVLADWQSPYITMTPEYEASQLELFVSMVQRGLIYRAFKPVQWSPASQTALAEAEVEYLDHTSTSVHVCFGLTPDFDSLPTHITRVGCLVWTTTPWTLLANQALAVGKDLEYVLVEHGTMALVVAKARLEELRILLDSPLKVLGEVIPHLLKNMQASHPLEDRQVPIVFADHVSDDAGTGIVHMAPAHGKEDYFACLDNGLNIDRNLVDEKGCYNDQAPETFRGLAVLDKGNEQVVQALEASGNLLHSGPHHHRYAYDWRTRTPLIQRATQQWFADVSELKTAAAKAVDTVKIHPEHGRSRLLNTIAGRNEWCISRQRVWGVPIPILMDQATDEPLLDDDVLQHAIELVRKHGSNIWWEASIQELLPEGYDTRGRSFYKLQDTMDVWFDSGSSWHAVTQQRHPDSKQADVYLEGSDQHRGWFQSSLLTKMATTTDELPPFKTLLTHGFVLDDDNEKMSKSLGNGIDPKTVINGGKNQKKEPAYGADTLRLWVASVDYTGDVKVGPETLKTVSNNLRKIRNASRFMLGNLANFEHDKDAVEYADLPLIDQYMLDRLYAWQGQVQQEYEAYNFLAVTQLVLNFIATDLSSFYFETVKDRLYADTGSSVSRRAACTVLHHVLHSLSLAMCPITPHLAEELYFFRQGIDPSAGDPLDTSIMYQTWPDLEPFANQSAAYEIGVVRKMREGVFSAVEQARMAGLIKGSMDARVTLSDYSSIPESLLETDNHGDSQLLNIFMAAEVVQGQVQEGPDAAVVDIPSLGVSIKVEPTHLHKCPRCWRFRSAHEDALCMRCVDAVGE